MSASQRVLALAAWGDPFDPSTWSGTPSNLANVWRDQGVELLNLNCRPSQAAIAAAHLVDKLCGYDIAYTRRRLARAQCVRLSAELPPECAGILHMSSVTVPPPGSTPGVRHFLLCDSMFDYWAQFGTVESALSDKQKEAGEKDEREAVAALSHAFPTGEHAAHSLRHHYGMDAQNITVVGTGRGKIRALEGDKDYASKKLLMVAKQRFEDKGGPLLIEAIQIARQSEPEIELTLVSPEEYAPFTQGKEGVHLTGQLEWDELQRLFDEAPLYAMPATCEPWGLVYAEALATKTPILGLRRASLPELTGGGEYGFLVDEASPQAVADGIIEALRDPARLQKMGEEGQEYCLEHFSWERTASRISHALWGGLPTSAPKK